MLPCSRQSSVIRSAGASWGISGSFVVAAPAGLARIQERSEPLVGEPGQAGHLERIQIDHAAVVLVLDSQARAVGARVDLQRDRAELRRQLEATGLPRGCGSITGTRALRWIWRHWHSVYCRQCRSAPASSSFAAD